LVDYPQIGCDSLRPFSHPEETITMLENVGSSDFEFYQTLVESDPTLVEPPILGHGKGSYVVIKAEKGHEK